MADVCPPHSEFCHAHKTLSPLPADLLMFSSLLSSLSIKNAEVTHLQCACKITFGAHFLLSKIPPNMPLLGIVKINNALDTENNILIISSFAVLGFLFGSFKGVVHPKFLSLLTHTHVFPNLYDSFFFSTVEH